MNAFRILTIHPLCLRQIEVLFETSGWTLAALGKQAVARQGIRPDGTFRTNNILWITRSVIHIDMREQTLPTVARYIGRAFARALSNHTLHTFNLPLHF